LAENYVFFPYISVGAPLPMFPLEVPGQFNHEEESWGYSVVKVA